MGAAAEASSRESRSGAWAAATRASFSTSRLRPSAQSTSTSQNSSMRLAKELVGLRAPLATTRRWAPDSSRRVQMRSLSLSLVLRRTMARVA